MDIVLGVSMTPTTVRMVLVEGDKADGRTVDHDVFDITAIDSAANSSASDQVIAAILGTQQSAAAGGHRLIATGVTWSDHDEAGVLRESLAGRGIDDVMLVSQLHAAGALAQAAGRAVGYEKTALLFVERDTATLSVVQAHDASIVKVVSRSLHSTDAMAVMAEMVTDLDAQDVRPGGVFVVGSGVDVTAVKEHLEHHVSLPVSAPEDSPMALARGAALAAASAPRFEATTIGLAYSQDPDGPTAADPAFVATQVRPVSVAAPVEDVEDDAVVEDESRRPFLLVGSTLTSIFVVGVVALVISLAVSIRPTVDQRPSPGESIVVPSTSAPAPVPPVAQQVQPPPAPAETKPPETIPAPVPVVQEQPQQAPRQVFVETPQAPASVPAAAPPAPAAEPSPPAAPVPAPAPAAPAPAPVIAPPVIIPPVIQLFPRPSYRTPWYPQSPPTTQPQQPPWYPQQPTSQPQRPPIDEQPDYPVIPRQPVYTQQPQQPVIQQPQQPSILSPRIPFWPYWPGN